MANSLSSESAVKTKVYKPSRATRLFTVWRKLRRSKLSVTGFGIVLFIVLVAALAPMITPYDPKELGTSRLPPSMEHPFGTDSRGRDMFSLVVYGARISLYVGVASVIIEMLIGVSFGMIAGYFGGLIDELMMRITDVLMTIPTLILLIIAVAIFEVKSVHIIVLIMGLIGWPFMARVVRSEFLSLRERTYVEAARSMGASSWRIIVHHILPNTLSTVIVLATMDIPWYIFYEASLTFLGFGDPASPSWGVLLERGYDFARTQWWIITFPGLALFFTSLGFNLFGDGLRDALDVKETAR
ncbi:peptide ABC transporter permease [Candidatus Bathyarchaeota archaeon]|nr:MAG: peptide ABC transporter permease [Candidatus Bathyarchaeota archaeon]